MAETLSVSTDERLSVIDVTDRVAGALPADASGTATVFVPHTTAAVTINEGEPRLVEDLEAAFAELIADDGWAHDRIDNNADSHIRASLIGPSVTVPVSDGSLDLGTWQSILFVECDGPRTRSLEVRTG